MKYSTNFNMNKPELNEQYSLSHWNDNTDIIDTEMQAIRSGTDEVMKATLLNFCYPIGSLYWSSKSTNPASLFGGTWVQIKDKFVLACGDTYKTVGATGGASSVTLSISNMPSHTHSFTPSGEVSSSFEGIESTTKYMSNKSTGSFKALNYANSYRRSIITGVDGSVFTYDSSTNSSDTSSYWGTGNNSCTGTGNWYGYHTISMNVNHTHSVTPHGTVSSSFKGYGGTTSPEGSGTSFSILPPYVVKYCFERTA